MVSAKRGHQRGLAFDLYGTAELPAVPDQGEQQHIIHGNVGPAERAFVIEGAPGQNPHALEMAAFDRLPPAIKQLLDYGNDRLSALQLVQMIEKRQGK